MSKPLKLPFHGRICTPTRSIAALLMCRAQCEQQPLSQHHAGARAKLSAGDEHLDRFPHRARRGLVITLYPLLLRPSPSRCPASSTALEASESVKAEAGVSQRYKYFSVQCLCGVSSDRQYWRRETFMGRSL